MGFVKYTEVKHDIWKSDGIRKNILCLKSHIMRKVIDYYLQEDCDKLEVLIITMSTTEKEKK